MISGLPGPQRPDLLRQYELGSVPYEMARAEDESGGAHEGRPGKKRRKRSPRRWFRRWRRH